MKIRACKELQRFCEHKQASTGLNFASKLRIGQILQALDIFKRPFYTPHHEASKMLFAFIITHFHFKVSFKIIIVQ